MREGDAFDSNPTHGPSRELSFQMTGIRIRLMNNWVPTPILFPTGFQLLVEHGFIVTDSAAQHMEPDLKSYPNPSIFRGKIAPPTNKN
jgi:hypothetical protein